MNEFEIVAHSKTRCELKHSSGVKFVGKLMGCGEALHIYNAEGAEVTVLPTANQYSGITKQDLGLATKVLSDIALIEKQKAETLPAISSFRAKTLIVK